MADNAGNAGNAKAMSLNDLKKELVDRVEKTMFRDKMEHDSINLSHDHFLCQIHENLELLVAEKVEALGPVSYQEQERIHKEVFATMGSIMQSVVNNQKTYLHVLTFQRIEEPLHSVVDMEAKYNNRTHDSDDTLPDPMRPNFSRRVVRNSGMGVLDKLPLELKLMIAQELDIKSYLSLRRVCGSARDLLTKAPEYKAVTGMAEFTLAAIREKKMWDKITFIQVYAALISPECAICGKTGQYLYMPTATRCCQFCLYTCLDFRTVTLPSFIRHSPGIGPVKMRKSAVAICDAYLSGPIKLINYDHAVEVHHSPPGLDVGVGRISINLPIPCSWTNRQGQAREQCTTPIPFFHRQYKQRHPYLSCKGCALVYSEAVKNRNQPNMGRIGYQAYRKMLEALKEEYLRVYTRSAFYAHSLECKKTKWLWEMSEEGKKDVAHLENGLIRSGGVSMD